jgi:UrcA family protein
MNSSRNTFMVAAVACGLVMSAAVAQDVAEVKVLGSRTTVKVKPATNGLTPTPLYKTLELSYGVNASDLDLKLDSGMAALEKRVNDAALALCQEIGRQYPESAPDDATCAKQAAKRTMAQVRALSASVRK